MLCIVVLWIGRKEEVRCWVEGKEVGGEKVIWIIDIMASGMTDVKLTTIARKFWLQACQMLSRSTIAIPGLSRKNTGH